jgi:hypothetical protein
VAEVEHGVPTTVDLVAALRRFLADEVMPGTDDRLSFLARVAANVAATVERELIFGPGVARDHAERLARLGFDGDAELGEAIRAGDLDERFDEVIAAIRPGVVDRVRLWNPRYLEATDENQPEGDG